MRFEDAVVLVVVAVIAGLIIYYLTGGSQM